LSAFIVYLGLKGDFKLIPELKSQIWLSTNDKDVEEIYGDILRGENNYLIINSPSNKEEHPNNDKYSLNLSLPMPFKSKEYWTEENKNNIANELLKIANRIIPHLSKCIDLQIIASPYTLYKKTLNYHGAAYGWAGTRTQFVNTDITQKTHIENLYLAGHWTNLSSGITSVVNTGKSTAKLILTKERKKK
jgi:prolycopene isomerase